MVPHNMAVTRSGKRNGYPPLYRSIWLAGRVVPGQNSCNNQLKVAETGRLENKSRSNGYTIDSQTAEIEVRPSPHYCVP